MNKRERKYHIVKKMRKESAPLRSELIKGRRYGYEDIKALGERWYPGLPLMDAVRCLVRLFAESGNRIVQIDGIND